MDLHQSFSRGSISVAVVDTGRVSGELRLWCPAGHPLHRARARRLRKSTLIVATAGSTALGLAADQPTDGGVRVVHEFLLDGSLSGDDRALVANLLISAVELQAHDDRVTSLMVLLGSEIAPEVFQRAGYAIVGTGPGGAWVRKRLDHVSWLPTCSARLH